MSLSQYLAGLLPITLGSALTLSLGWMPFWVSSRTETTPMGERPPGWDRRPPPAWPEPPVPGPVPGPSTRAAAVASPATRSAATARLVPRPERWWRAGLATGAL